MLPIPNTNVAFGQATQMSKNDIDRLNRLYKCCECTLSRPDRTQTNTDTTLFEYSHSEHLWVPLIALSLNNVSLLMTRISSAETACHLWPAALKTSQRADEGVKDVGQI